MILVLGLARSAKWCPEWQLEAAEKVMRKGYGTLNSNGYLSQKMLQDVSLPLKWNGEPISAFRVHLYLIFQECTISTASATTCYICTMFIE